MRLQIGEEKEQHLTDIDGFARLRTLVGRDLAPGESVQVTIGRHEDGRLYAVTPPLVMEYPNMTVSFSIDGEGS